MSRKALQRQAGHPPQSEFCSFRHRQHCNCRLGQLPPTTFQATAGRNHLVVITVPTEASSLFAVRVKYCLFPLMTRMAVHSFVSGLRETLSERPWPS